MEEHREIRFKELKTKLIERGYRTKSIDESISKVKSLREDVLEKVERVHTQNKRVRAVFKFDQRLPDLSNILRTNWKTLVEDDNRLLEVFREPPMVCYKSGRNVRETSCQARLPPKRMRLAEDGFKRCMQPKCRLCPFTGLRNCKESPSQPLRGGGADKG